MFLIFCRIFNFVVLFGALAYLARGLVSGIFDRHKKQIEDDLASAEEAKKKAASLSSIIENLKLQIVKKKEEIFSGAKERAAASSKAIDEAGVANAAAVIEKAKASEDGLRSVMRSELSAETLAKIAELTGTVLKQGGFDESKKALNRHFIEQLKEILRAMPSDIAKMNTNAKTQHEQHITCFLVNFDIFLYFKNTHISRTKIT